MYNCFYGINTIKNLIKFNKKYIYKIFILSKRNDIRFLKLKSIIINNKISYSFVKNIFFKKIFKNKKFNHQGIVAFVKKGLLFRNNINSLLFLIKKLNKHFFLILDRINDPYNLGSCIRTAVSAGVNAIIVSKYNSVSIENNIVHKVSNGAIYKTFIIEVINISDIINLLHKYNFYVFGSCINNSKSIYKIKFNKYKSIALILGSEKNGIQSSFKKKCDYLFSIPINNNINSLNVSVAGGIIIFEILRQRKFFLY